MPIVYQPWQQNRWWHGSAKLIVHTASGDPLALVPAVRRSVESLDPDADVTRIFRLSDLVRDSAWRLNYATTCLVTLALLSFLLRSPAFSASWATQFANARASWASGWRSAPEECI